MQNTYVAGEMQGGVPRCRWETTRMRPGARGYDCIGFVGLCSQHLSQITPRTEHVEQSYGGSKLSGIGPEKAREPVRARYPRRQVGRALAPQRHKAMPANCGCTVQHVFSHAQIYITLNFRPLYRYITCIRCIHRDSPADFTLRPVFMRINHLAPKAAQPQCRTVHPHHSTI
jgi:hypothetical protein